jgi:proline iminopeptidase
MEGLWGFLLNELPGGRTRLVIGGYQALHPRWLGRFVFYWIYIPVVWVMQARTLAVLKRSIEREARARPLSVAMRKWLWHKDRELVTLRG